jgi:hypothetical protein
MNYLKSNTDTIKKAKFDNKIYKHDGTLLVENTNYTIGSEISYVGVVVNNIITLTIPTGVNLLEEGDNVLILEPDGLYRPNVVVNTGINKITVKKPILSAGDIVVTASDVSINLIALEDGVYTFSDHSSIIVSSTFINVFIAPDVLMERYRGRLTGYQIDWENMNRVAVLAVLAEYHFNLTFFRTVDFGQITELVIRKIGQHLEVSSDNLKYTNEYKEFKKIVDNGVQSDNGVLDTTSTSSNTNGFSWSWGVR